MQRPAGLLTARNCASLSESQAAHAGPSMVLLKAVLCMHSCSLNMNFRAGDSLQACFDPALGFCAATVAKRIYVIP